MRRFVLLLLLACAACGDDPASVVPAAPPVAPPAPGPAATFAAHGAFPWPADLPLVGLRTVGDLPPPETRLVLVLDPSGALSVDGRPAGLDALTGLLDDRFGAPPVAGTRDADILIAAARDLPWGTVQCVLQTLAGARVGRIFFAARPADDAEPGAIALFLPEDRDPPPPGDPPPRIEVAVGDDWPPSDALGLHDVLRRFDAPSVVGVAAAPSAPVGLVLRLADVAALEGAAAFMFDGAAPSADHDLVHLTATLTSGERARHIRVGGADLAPPSALIPHADRVQGAYAGFAASFRGPFGPEAEPDSDDDR